MHYKSRETLIRVDGILQGISFTIPEEYKLAIKTASEGIRRVLQEELEPLKKLSSNEAVNKIVNIKRNELSCNCPHCNEPHLFMLTNNLDKEKLWPCSECKKEFKIGEY